MQFKNWLFIVENVFLEGFKEKREQFIKQGYQANIVDSYLSEFKKIKDKKYKQVNDNIPTLAVKDRINIDAYQDFKELETFVDYIRGQVDLEGATFTDVNFTGKPIYENNKIEIFYAETPKACIEYKGNVPYSWCVARKDSSNMFYSYRYQNHQPAFYFVKNKERTKKEFDSWNTSNSKFSGKFKDKYHFFVIQVIKNSNIESKESKQYIITSAQNDGEEQVSWNEILHIDPDLNELQSVFKPVPLSDEDVEYYNKFKNGLSDEEFIKLPYEGKSRYIDIYVGIDKELSDKQFYSLPNDLKNKYIGLGIGLTNPQYKMIESDNKLKNRYTEATKMKIEDLVDNKIKLDLKPTEIDVLINNTDIIKNWSALHEENIKNLLEKAIDKDKISLAIINNKNNLTVWIIKFILNVSTNKSNIADLMLSSQKNLSPESKDALIKSLVEFTPKEKRDKVIVDFLAKTPDLSSDSLTNIIKLATDKDEIAKQLIYKKQIFFLSDSSKILKEVEDEAKIALMILQKKFMSAVAGKRMPSLSNEEIKLFSSCGQIVIKTIAKRFKLLDPKGIEYLITMAENKPEIANYIVDNSETYKENIIPALSMLKIKNKDLNLDDTLEKIISKYKDFDLVYLQSLMYFAKDKDKIEKAILNKIPNLSEKDLHHLFKDYKQ